MQDFDLLRYLSYRILQKEPLPIIFIKSNLENHQRRCHRFQQIRQMNNQVKLNSLLLLFAICMIPVCMAKDSLIEQSLKKSIEHYCSKPFFEERRENLEHTYEIWNSIVKPFLLRHHVDKLKLVFIWLDSSTPQTQCWLIAESMIYEMKIDNKNIYSFTLKERRTPASIFSIIDQLKEDTANPSDDQFPVRSSGNAIFLYIFPEKEKEATCIYTIPPHSYQKTRMRLYINFFRNLGVELPFTQTWELENKE